MSDNMPIIGRPILPPGQTPPGPSRGKAPSSGPSFDQVLNGQIQSPALRFSRHAQERLVSRGIDLGTEQMARLESAVDQVGAKGGRQSLVMLDGTALVVSVKNQTVVTAVDQNSLKGNVFTNIDSAIIA
ncbi:MAG: flagellar protein [Desulfuromonas sp.]|uniref:TIGR02530 family flagellar biosynthesis protein n=1 Tax=Desulfuromonas sp. TaxID=892 RepID=UPI000CC5E6A5|nr:TIGR02530 family flagellar biosynthesis protein [Desulfuromonas sp.]PLX84492.1 MAG: flagellar protein [Desulfuromonas sp.]